LIRRRRRRDASYGQVSRLAPVAPHEKVGLLSECPLNQTHCPQSSSVVTMLNWLENA
jgi:hypothetical protein